MKIREMQATFGTLNHAKLELGEGLNIVQAPNESGKSTWCGFLRAMLYGVSTSQREKAGFLPDKVRYAPWQGGLMQGSMQVEHQGREITLERTSRPNVPMQKLVAVYKDTSEKVPGLDAAGVEAGERLTGAPEEVFSRTAFIGQSGVAVSQTPELERRIGAIISTGDETVSASEVAKRLYAWKRGLDNNRGGGALIRDKLAYDQQHERLRELRRKHEALADLRREQERLQEQQTQLEADMDIHEQLSQRSEQQRILDAGKKARLAREDAEMLCRRLVYRDRLVKAEDLGEIQGAYAGFETLATTCVSADQLVTDAHAALKNAADAKARFSFAAVPESEVAKAAEEITALVPQAAAEKEKAAKNPVKFLPLLVSLFAILLAGASALWFYNPAIIFSCVGVMVLGVVLYFVLRAKKQPMPVNDALQQLLAQFGYPAAEVFLRDAGAFSAACARESTLESAARQAEERFAASRDGAKAAADEALEKAQALDPTVTDVRQIPKLLAATRKSMEALQAAEANAAALESGYQAMCEGFDGDLSQEMEYLPQPMRSWEDTRSALNRTRQRHEDVLKQLTLEEGGLRVSGDPAVILGEMQALEAEMQQNREKLTALNLAIEEMEGAAAELQGRFSPMLGKVASQYLSRLTGGKYDTVAFDKAFSAMVTQSGDDVAHQALYLSQGAADQMYLSLRLAMVKLLLTGEEPCPIVLDDALTNFDDARTRTALELLQEIARERQVIVFTCHGREAKIAGNWPGVRVTTI